MRLAATASFALLLGCGAGDQTRAARDDSGDTKLVYAHPTINICPHFEGSFILPQSIPLDTSAFIAVRAVKPDSNVELTYRWSATSGEFTAPTRPTTEYRCGDLGDQTLTVVAVDEADCEVPLHLDVTCLTQ
jgi:hypothetical protein